MVKQTCLPETGAPAVGRALDLLETLSRSSHGLTLSELSRRLGIPKSTTHHLIYALTARGYLQKIPWTRQYSLGVRAFDFTPKGIAEDQLRQFSSPRIQALAKKLDIVVQTAVVKGDEGMVIDRIDPHPLPSGGTWPGHHFHLHSTAAGKALIAWLSDAELERLFPSRSLCKFTIKTVTNFEKLKAHLREVRERGYAVNDEEYNLQRRAIAAPIFNQTGSVVASLSVDGSIIEIPIQRIPRLADELVAAAREITRQIVAH